MSDTPKTADALRPTGAEFTPGPWRYEPLVIDTFGNESVVDAFGCVVATIVDDGNSEENCIANARLIAAAPDGHSVIRRFRRKLETYVSVYPGDKELRGLLADCDAYLSKAEGR